MNLINERRESFKVALSGWLGNREYTIGECYPFEDLKGLAKDMKYTLGEWGIEFVDTHTFGETVTYVGNWISEDVSVHINLNPTKDRMGFRVVYKWTGIIDIV
jgi:hypothetical protein